MGYFFGFKLHLVVNDQGGLINFAVTPGNIDDREPLKNGCLIDGLKGRLYGDKGYISQELAEMLFVDGLKLITGIRRNMKDKMMELSDKILLRKRSIIETINDELKKRLSDRSFSSSLLW